MRTDFTLHPGYRASQARPKRNLPEERDHPDLRRRPGIRLFAGFGAHPWSPSRPKPIARGACHRGPTINRPFQSPRCARVPIRSAESWRDEVSCTMSVTAWSGKSRRRPRLYGMVRHSAPALGLTALGSARRGGVRSGLRWAGLVLAWVLGRVRRHEAGERSRCGDAAQILCRMNRRCRIAR